MLKRLLFTFLTVMVLYSAILVAYRLNEPEKEELVSELNDEALPYSSLEDYTLNSGTSSHHFYFVCSPQDNDCIYMETTVLKTVENHTGLKMADILEYVDITDSIRKLDTTHMMEQWHITGYPAFIACHVEDNQIVVDNTIVSTVQYPLSAENVESWLMQNGLYVTATAVPLDTAIPE